MNRKAIAMAAILVVVFGFLVFRGDRRRQSTQQAPEHAGGTTATTAGVSWQTESNAAVTPEGADSEFAHQFFPGIRGFFTTLQSIGVNPLGAEIKPDACSNVRIDEIPGGKICRLVINDDWTATYIKKTNFSGVMHFGQRGPDNPFRAISFADTNTLERLSRTAVIMNESEVSRIASRVANVFGIDRLQFQKPETHEEGLFEHHLGVYSVRFRKKGTDPVNQMNYTRHFSLKATSPTSAVLVRYSHLDAGLR